MRAISSSLKARIVTVLILPSIPLAMTSRPSAACASRSKRWAARWSGCSSSRSSDPIRYLATSCSEQSSCDGHPAREVGLPERHGGYASGTITPLERAARRSCIVSHNSRPRRRVAAVLVVFGLLVTACSGSAATSTPADSAAPAASEAPASAAPTQRTCCRYRGAAVPRSRWPRCAAAG